MESLFPAGPASVPEQLTAPSPSYRRHAWLAMAGLLAFVLVYFGLLYWFGRTAWNIFAGIGSSNGDWEFPQLLGGCFALFLFVFMAKALVFIKRAPRTEDIELKPADEPELFAFLHKLADTARAPRPHRVYVSARVNAAVFYDLSLANLIFPSRKNLEIGLGLATVLSLGEFKAVLAHEFGHFAQRSMAVGRWVYIAQQVAGHIIAKRDALDDFLRVISGIDLRIAWIGWLLQLIVWSIRSLVELLFRVVVLAQRALSREMEYQADLVACSLTGSDALVHALHRLGAADDAWSRAVGFAGSELAQERPVKDLFAVQVRILERMRALLGDPAHGASPARSPEGGAHRVFRDELARPPQMWSTHPANADREQNIKRRYVPADIDERPAMLLFANPEDLRARVTSVLFPTGDKPVAPLEETLARVDTDFEQPSLHARYRGAYLGRCAFLPWKDAEEMYSEVHVHAGNEHGWREAIAGLYPEDLNDRVDRLKALEGEQATLEAILDGFLEAPGGIVRWRGNELRKRQLPKALEEVKRELEMQREAVRDHDRRCRSLHLAIARRAGAGWEHYLRSLGEVAHYASHSHADLRDAAGLLQNTLSIVLADSKVSADELRRVIACARQVHTALADVYAKVPLVVIDADVQRRLGATWAEALGEFRLPAPAEENIQAWINAIDGWVDGAAGALSALKRHCLEAMLDVESRMAATLDGGDLGTAPPPLAAPKQYPRLIVGQERKLQKKLDWWSRFQTADGTVATLARLAIAGSIVGAVVWAGASMSGVTVHVYNGLPVAVRVSVDGVEAEVAPHSTRDLSVASTTSHHVLAYDPSGQLIEEFDATQDGVSSVYNVGGAATLMSWVASYGSAGEQEQQTLGSPRWTAASADYFFTEPPQQINTKGSGGTRRVLTAIVDAPPQYMLDAAAEADRAILLATHARWDGGESPYLMQWLGMASQTPGFDKLLEARLQTNPKDIFALRLQQDSATEPSAKQAVCARHAALAAAAPDDADLQYLAVRCRKDDRAQDEAFLAAQQRWPDNPWLKLASGYVHAGRGDWAKGRELMDSAAQMVPATGDWLMLDIARIDRLSGAEPPGEAMTQRSDMLRTMIALESGVGTENTPMSAYARLGRGEFEDSVVAIGQDKEQWPRFAWLLAASDGAPRERVKQVLATGASQGIDEVTLWPALALTVREGGDPAALLAKGREIADQDSPRLLAFFEALRAGAGVDAAEATLDGASPRARGQAYAMAAVMLGERCPAKWRDGAKRLLFAPERPYLG